MIRVKARIHGTEGRSILRSATVDTGTTGGLFLPRADAERIGVVLVPPVRPVLAVDGRQIPGLAGVVRVELPEARVEATTYVFSPDAPSGEVLLGALFLGQVGARIAIGAKTWTFKPPKARRPNPDWAGYIDIGQWIVPTHRPVTTWW